MWPFGKKCETEEAIKENKTATEKLKEMLEDEISLEKRPSTNSSVVLHYPKHRGVQKPATDT